MAANIQIWAGTRNGDRHFGRSYQDAQLDAAGVFRSNPRVQKPKFNGGITSPLETRLQTGDKIYRFAGSRQTRLEDQIRGSWWFDYDTCLFLWSKVKDDSDEGFRNVARTAFAVLDEWSDMNFCVSGVLAYDFWAISGNTARADSGATHAINPYGLLVRQIFIPGGLTRNDFNIVRPASLTRVGY